MSQVKNDPPANRTAAQVWERIGSTGKRLYISGWLCVFALASGNTSGAAPIIKYSSPSSLAPGQWTEVTFFGSGLRGASNVWATFEGQSEFLRSTEDEAVCKFLLPKDWPTGFGAVRLGGTNGISTPHLMLFDPLTSVVSNGTNHTSALAQELKPGTAVDGACREKTSDFYKVRARKGQRLWFEVVAQRLDSALDPLARLFDAHGRELVFCEDTPGAGVDCRFPYTFSSSGEYTIELRDTRYEGGAAYRYRLRVGEFSGEPLPLPFAIKAALKQPTSDLPRVAGTEAGESKWQQIPIPVHLDGRFRKPKERYHFSFEAKKGERLVFRSATRSLGSPCDLYLRLENLEGKKLAESALTGPEETRMTNTFKEAGAYRLLVEEATLSGGPEFFYQLEIAPYQPGFGLNIEPETLLGASGEKVEFKVSQERWGYDGPITLELDGIPPGFTLENNVLAPKTNAATVTLVLPASLTPEQILNFRITGHAKIDGKECVTVAGTKPALHKVFPHLPWPPAALDGWITLAITPGRAKP